MDEGLNDDDILSRNPESVCRREEDGAYLFDPGMDTLKYINNSGAHIYEFCDGMHTVGSIIKTMRDLYPETAEEKLREDIKNYLHSLIITNFLKKI